MTPIGRRSFLNRSVIAALGTGLGPLVSRSALGANDRVVMVVMGCGGRGAYLAMEFAKRPDVAIAYVVDPDSRRVGALAQQIEALTGKRPRELQDIRLALEDKNVDAVLNATPDHWHALGTIWACQAEKDIYVEKPVAHNIREGRQMVEAARKYRRIVQVGAQNRSAEYCMRAYEYLHSKDFGDIHFVRVLNSKERPTIGKKPDTETPPGVDYDMWLGPAPLRPFNENHFHYAWHWFWVYSGGDTINDGVHQIDIARWMIDRTYPKAVCSAGGIHFYQDDQETPDTHTVNWDFDGLTMVFEQTLWSPYLKKTTLPEREVDDLPKWPFNGTRIEIYGTKQQMFLGRHGDGWEAFDANGRSVASRTSGFTEINRAHIQNFMDCIRSRNLPNGDIEKLHLSTLLCHYGNIAYRTGRRLLIDPQTEGILDDREANRLVKRSYRKPYVVPDRV